MSGAPPDDYGSGSAWWQGMPRLTADVACNESSHPIVWEGGELLPVAHDDPEGEAVLTALGAPPATCLLLADRWRRHSDDLRVLALARRHRGQRVGISPAELAEVEAAATPSLNKNPLIISADQALRMRVRQLDRLRYERLELLSLFALPGGFQDRLTLTVASAWAVRRRVTAEPAGGADAAGADAAGATGGTRAGIGPSELAALAAALVGRAQPAIEAWSRRAADVALASPGSTPEVTATPDGRVNALLGLDWLAGIWCRDLALADGRFVLEALTVTDDHAEVLAIDRPGGVPAPVELRRSGPNRSWRAI